MTSFEEMKVCNKYKDMPVEAKYEAARPELDQIVEKGKSPKACMIALRDEIYKILVWFCLA